MSAESQTPRPERADKARNRARILAAASEVFAERGVGAQMDEIAAQAGVGVGTLYRHFATKDALMVAMVERKFEKILAIVTAAVEHGDGEPFDVLAGALREGAEIAAADAAAQHALMHAGAVVWAEAAPVFSELRAATGILIARAQAAGSLRSDLDAEDIPMIMSGVSAVMPIPEWDWRRYLEIMLDGMRTPLADLPSRRCGPR